jgi:hypothetical protein
MSMLSESCHSITQTQTLTSHAVSTSQLTLDNAVTLSTGKYGELALSGAELLQVRGDTTYLQLTINHVPLQAAVLPWNPAGSTALTFARSSMLQAVQTVLDKIASAPASPLTTSRTMYMLAMTLATAWSQTVPPAERDKGASVQGTHDAWNFDVHYGQAAGLSSQDASTYVVYAITQLMPSFVLSYDPEFVLTQQRQWMRWSVEEQQAELARVAAANNWTAYKAAWDAWYAHRSGDGYNTVGAYVATVNDIGNIATPLVVTGTADPLGNGQWTPLTLPSGKTQAYLGYNWSQVQSTCLSSEQMAAMEAVATPLFPTEGERAAEVAVVKDISAALSDTEKVIAEVWAGGPLTYTPPGQLVWMWKDFMRRLLGAQLELDSTWAETNVHVLSFLDLTVSLFEGSRVIWGVKSQYVQSRPIQEIRHRYFGTAISSWNSSSPIPAATWVPYQMSNFVTPPFGDFSSGHSYFSQCFANCMTYWFGATIPSVATTTVDASQLLHFSPLFHSAPLLSLLPYATFYVTPGSSEVQPGEVPAAAVVLNFPTWAALSHEVGMSRLYGGIHCISAHNASVAVANALYPVVHAAWGVQKSV